MLAYKENIKLESNKLVIDLPEYFAGNYVEVIVLEQNYNKGVEKDKVKFLVNEPYDFDLNPASTFSRDEIYD